MLASLLKASSFFQYDLSSFQGDGKKSIKLIPSNTQLHLGHAHFLSILALELRAMGRLHSGWHTLMPAGLPDEM